MVSITLGQISSEEIFWDFSAQDKMTELFEPSRRIPTPWPPAGHLLRELDVLLSVERHLVHQIPRGHVHVFIHGPPSGRAAGVVIDEMEVEFANPFALFPLPPYPLSPRTSSPEKALDEMD